MYQLPVKNMEPFMHEPSFLRELINKKMDPLDEKIVNSPSNQKAKQEGKTYISAIYHIDPNDLY